MNIKNENSRKRLKEKLTRNLIKLQRTSGPLDLNSLLTFSEKKEPKSRFEIAKRNHDNF